MELSPTSSSSMRLRSKERQDANRSLNLPKHTNRLLNSVILAVGPLHSHHRLSRNRERFQFLTRAILSSFPTPLTRWAGITIYTRPIGSSSTNQVLKPNHALPLTGPAACTERMHWCHESPQIHTGHLCWP